MRITNNVYLLSGDYFSAVNNSAVLGCVYGIRTDKGIILIDAGNPVSGPAMLRETLAYFDVNEPITHLIITHAHIDHSGGAAELQKAGAKVIVGQEDAMYCTNGGFSGMNSPFDDSHGFPALNPDICIAEDRAMEINGLDFKFIKIPGHTPGSIAVLVTVDKKTVLFTGDALQPDGITLGLVTLGWQGDPGFSSKAIVDSMMKLLKYETDMILPGHGRICLRNGTAVLRLAAKTAALTLR